MRKLIWESMLSADMNARYWDELSAPRLADTARMGLAGVSWGLYSLRGRGMPNPLAQTTSNFVRAVPPMLIASAVALPQFHVEAKGAWLAVPILAASGGLLFLREAISERLARS